MFFPKADQQWLASRFPVSTGRHFAVGSFNVSFTVWQRKVDVFVSTTFLLWKKKCDVSICIVKLDLMIVVLCVAWQDKWSPDLLISAMLAVWILDSLIRFRPSWMKQSASESLHTVPTVSILQITQPTHLLLVLPPCVCYHGWSETVKLCDRTGWSYCVILGTNCNSLQKTTSGQISPMHCQPFRQRDTWCGVNFFDLMV